MVKDIIDTVQNTLALIGLGAIIVVGIFSFSGFFQHHCMSLVGKVVCVF